LAIDIKTQYTARLRYLFNIHKICSQNQPDFEVSFDQGIGSFVPRDSIKSKALLKISRLLVGFVVRVEKSQVCGVNSHSRSTSSIQISACVEYLQSNMVICSLTCRTYWEGTWHFLHMLLVD